jgi:hypothetical protein
VIDAAQIERARLNVTLTLYAIARLIEARATGDARFIEAADAIKQIAETMDQISDATVLRIATAKTISEGLLSGMITSRLAAIGFAVPHCANAAEFFHPLVEQAEVILHRARPRLH